MQLAARQEYLWEKSKRLEAVGFLPLCSSLFSYDISKKKKSTGREREGRKSVEDIESGNQTLLREIQATIKTFNFKRLSLLMFCKAAVFINRM